MSDPKKIVSRPAEEKEKSSGRSFLDYLQRLITVTLSDGRLIVGRFNAFDKHMNLVVSQAHEYPKNSQASAAAAGKILDNKRDVGLVIIRGEHVVNITAVKKKKTVDAKATGNNGGASAVPGAAVSKTSQPNLPKASGARRQRKEDDE